MLDRGFWSGRRVLLTGHTGFKGAWAARWLLRAGADVNGLARKPPTTPSLYSLLELSGEMKSHTVDLADLEGLHTVVSALRPEIVLHMAAQALVPDSYRDPAATWQTNVLGTINLLEALRGSEDLKAVLVVTSDKVYENPERGEPFTEGDRLGGADPYSSSKAATEIAVASWRDSFFRDVCPVATARAGNVIGGGDWARGRLVPDIVRSIVDNKPINLRNPRAKRPWQHVVDALCGYFLYLEHLATGKQPPLALNFGPRLGEELTVEAVVECLARSFGVPLDRKSQPAADMPEKQTLLLDSSLARQSLGWRPLLSVEEAIAWTAEWFSEWKAGKELTAITDKQLECYEAGVK